MDISTWKRSILFMKIVEEPDGRDRDEEAERRRDESLGDAGRDAPRCRPSPVMAMPRKALMMPMTVPKRPMKGAVVPIVASPERPFFMSAVVISASRSIARSAASIGSCPGVSAVPLAMSCWNS